MNDAMARRVTAARPHDRVAVLERDLDLQRLEALLDGTTAEGSLALVSGEAGVGKSTLVELLRTRAHGSVMVRSGRCDDLSTPAPFGPLHEMRATLSPDVGEALRRGARQELFTGLLDELRSGRNLLLVEDIHWADEATIDLLRYVGRRIRDTQCLLVCTFRTGEVSRGNPLLALLGELAPIAERLEVQTLTYDSVVELARDHAIAPGRLYALTGGNPFFVTQMLLHPEADLPATVEEAVLARTRALPERAWDVLGLIGVAPQGVPLDTIAGLGEAAERDADHACRLQLLVVDDRRLRARHELIRQVFESALPPTRRRRFHLKMLQLLTARPDTVADEAVLAHHAVGAGVTELILQHSLRAAHRAAQDGAHRQAALHFADALDHRDAMAAETLHRTLEAHAYECYLTGELDTAANMIGQAVAGSDNLVDRGRCLRFQSRLRWFQGDRTGALEAGRAAVEVLRLHPVDDSHELAYAYSNMAQLAMLDHDHAALREWGPRATELARRCDDVEVLAHALNNQGTGEGSADGRRRLLEESLVLSLDHDLHEHAARAYTNLSFHEVWDRELPTARRLLEEGMSYTEARDLGTWWAYMRGTRSELRLLEGHWPGAQADADAVRTTTDGPLMRHQATGVAARLAVRRGDPDAEVLAQQFLDDAIKIGEYPRLVSACALAVEYRWHTGESLWAPEEERAAIRSAEHRMDAWGLAPIHLWLAVLGEPIAGRVGSPVAVPVDGDAAPAARDWDRRGCVFEAALLSAHAAEIDLRRDGVARLSKLGAEGTLRALRRHLPRRGVEGLPRGPNRSTRSNPFGLTSRQLEVLRLLAQGATNATIAEELVISAKTVEHHVSAVLAKSGSSSRGEAVAKARGQGIV